MERWREAARSLGRPPPRWIAERGEKARRNRISVENSCSLEERKAGVCHVDSLVWGRFTSVEALREARGTARPSGRYLVDSASSHMLVSKIKPCMSKYKQLYCETANGSLNQLSFI